MSQHQERTGDLRTSVCFLKTDDGVYVDLQIPQSAATYALRKSRTRCYDMGRDDNHCVNHCTIGICDYRTALKAFAAGCEYIAQHTAKLAETIITDKLNSTPTTSSWKMSSDEFYNEGEYKTITARQLEVEYRNSAREECKSGWAITSPA